MDRPCLLQSLIADIDFPVEPDPEPEECPAGLVFSYCGCRKTCDDMHAMCAMCYEGCYCPPAKPYLLPDGSCGSAEQCTKPPGQPS